MIPGDWTLEHTRGDDFDVVFVFQSSVFVTDENPTGLFDFTDWSDPAAQVRRKPAAAEIATDLGATFGDDPTQGRVYLALPDREVFPSKNVPLEWSWDLQMTNPEGKRRTWLAGPYTVNPDTTRSDD